MTAHVRTYMYVTWVGHARDNVEQLLKKVVHPSARLRSVVPTWSRVTIKRLVREGTAAGVRQFKQQQQLLMNAHAAIMSYDYIWCTCILIGS